MTESISLKIAEGKLHHIGSGYDTSLNKKHNLLGTKKGGIEKYRLLIVH